MTGRLQAVLKIELLSDLCSGSGYAYTGIIDNDVCYDTYGIPFIPAKRMKGCLRETLETALYALYPDTADKIFGKAGDDTCSDFTITNAYVEGYESLCADIQNRKEKHDLISYVYSQENILSRFTHTLGQTALDKEGTAIDTSLRYTRVVNQYSPLAEGRHNMTFYAETSFSEENKTMIEEIVKGTRHIGLKRNRGLGNVHCSLVQCRKIPETLIDSTGADGEQEVLLEVKIHNTSPLMLSKTDENTSVKHILGQFLLGALAVRYLQTEGKTADSQEFQDLFLNGKVKYTNLYPGSNDRIYYPAPLYLNKMKKSKKPVCVLGKKIPETADPDYSPQDGNQPKKLKGQYVWWENNRMDTIELNSDIVYHHSHSKKNANGDPGLLYGMEVLREGSTFAGSIICPAKYKSLITSLLLAGDLYFGKSKSSQYGRCRAEIKQGCLPSKTTISAGKHVVITFLSDALILSDSGSYTVYQDEVEKIVARQLGIHADEETEKQYLSNIQTTQYTGYLGVWNLRRNTEPAVAAGSCLTFRLKDDFVSEQMFIGERNLEGYGQIRISCAEETPYQMEMVPAKNDIAYNSTTNNEMKFLMKDLLIDYWLDQVKLDAVESRKSDFGNLSNSELGRITLMLKESVEENKTSFYKAFNSFINRVDSIKSDTIKNAAKKVVQLVGKSDEEGYTLDFHNMHAEKLKTVRKELTELGYTDNEINAFAKAQWSNYLMYLLTERKYGGGQ